MSKEIILCTSCNGRGSIEQKELEDYHKGEYRFWDERCETCKGSGRLIRETVVHLSPYRKSKL